MSNASTTKIDTTLYHNSPHGELCLVKMCQWVMWGHTFTNHNSPCDELWHKVVPISMVQDYSFKIEDVGVKQK